MIWKAKTSTYWVSTDQGELQAQVVVIPEKNRVAWRVQDSGKTVAKGRSDTILTAMNESCTALLKYKDEKARQNTMKLSQTTFDDFKGYPEFTADA